MDNQDPSGSGRHTRRGDRRVRHVGAPGGLERRGGHGRRATDALKMACPFCGNSESRVTKTNGRPTDDKVYRRRECAECRRRFSTSERVDREQLEKTHPELAQLFEDQDLSPTWKNAERLLHVVWGNAKERRYVKRDFLALQKVLGSLRKVS